MFILGGKSASSMKDWGLMEVKVFHRYIKAEARIRTWARALSLLAYSEIIVLITPRHYIVIYYHTLVIPLCGYIFIEKWIYILVGTCQQRRLYFYPQIRHFIAATFYISLIFDDFMCISHGSQ